MPSYADVSSFEDYFKQAEEAAQAAAGNYRDAKYEEADRGYFSTNTLLDTQKNALTANQPLVEEGIQASIAAEKLPVYQGKEESLAEYGRQERDLQDYTKGAINTASRTFNELATAIPRYAGTSAGGAVGEIIGRQTARDIGAATREQQKGLMDIADSRQRVIKFASEKVAAIEAMGQNLLRKAKQDFLNKLDEIAANRRIAENDRNSLRRQALYEYQADVENARAGIESNKYALNKWAYEKNLNLKNAEEQYQRDIAREDFEYERSRKNSGSGFDLPNFFANYLNRGNQENTSTPPSYNVSQIIGDWTRANSGGINQSPYSIDPYGELSGSNTFDYDAISTYLREGGL